MSDQPYECDGCTCCNKADCHRGRDSGCPESSDGVILCPCTETS